MLKMLMGSLKQKMLIAFRVYDVDLDESITVEEVKIVLRNIPITYNERHGNSFSKDMLTRVELMERKEADN
jgi:Ca2+-binding EF-hand superfamily protein